MFYKCSADIAAFTTNIITQTSIGTGVRAWQAKQVFTNLDRGSIGSKRLSINIFVAPIEDKMPLSLHCMSREEGYKITICDVVDVQGKHYGIAVDIFSTKTDVVLKSLLATMNRNDTLTLITFGDHTETVHFDMTTNVQEIVYESMNRQEHGCNISNALYELDQLECDERIMISNGDYDDGEPLVNLNNSVLLISPGNCTYPEITMSGDIVTDAHLILLGGGRVSYRKRIRQLLEKQRPQYYNIIVRAGELHFVAPLAFGGCKTLFVGDFEGKLRLKYYNSEGNKYIEEIEIN